MPKEKLMLMKPMKNRKPSMTARRTKKNMNMKARRKTVPAGITKRTMAETTKRQRMKHQTERLSVKAQ